MKTPASFERIDPRLTFAGLIALTLALGPAARPDAIAWLDAICGGGLFASGGKAQAASHSPAASRPATTVTVLSCEALPNVPGKSVTTALVAFPPLGFTPAHRHPGSVTAVVLEGTIRSQLAGAPPANYTRGQTWFEPPGTLHVFAENPDPARPARLLATFVADTNCGPLTIPER
ncbi:cupin domain-containing protein [Paraburkholderia acidisoli]|uniref:Cupin domain-containing protein n=1 Tax=Paraburkholderia acidisoli TaxID=2571748 RepID=A0A7Z2GRQ9_9BURK|nr:cupin domain-containing protein [Paraburkholderia acidisoli]QGZ66751.1 cupin domain-containing protein [Paraburkholderia acidisoli]